MTRCTIVVFCLATLWLAGCGQVRHFGTRCPGFTENRVIRLSHIPGTPISIKTYNGRVYVEATDRSDVEINALICARSEERLDSTPILTQRDEGGTLRIEVKWPAGGRKNGESASFEIYVPEVDGIFASTSNAPVRIKGLSGTAELITNNDRIEATNHHGILRATTSNDAIVIVRNQGSITARSSNDDIRINGVTGPVDARTSNGTIEVNSAESSVFARTSNDQISISLTDSAIGPIDVETSNDPILLVLGENFAGDVDLITNERCIVDESLRRHAFRDGDKYVRLSIGKGEKSRLATRNAPIYVMARDTAQ
ncbi:MAG: hypothetical protein OYM47_05515 [Gemmatimonadota bacterium]|nr:hypothetical protein [Gemmatimonadota bacterium]